MSNEDGGTPTELLYAKYGRTTDIEWIYEGTKPNADNFRVWNVYEDNLMITLPAYQVAAYVYGVQTIMIPFSKLKTILKPDGIISGRIA